MNEFLPKETKEFFSHKDEYQKKWEEDCIKNVEDLAEQAWILGIDIVSVRLKGNQMIKGRKGLLYGGDVINLAAPNIRKINTSGCGWINVLPPIKEITEKPKKVLYR